MKYCLDCGTTDWPKTETPGSFFIEVILWLCFLVPGVIYSVWRLAARYSGCSACGSKRIVPVNSPVAQKMIGSVARPAPILERQFCGYCGTQMVAGNRFCG